MMLIWTYVNVCHNSIPMYAYVGMYPYVCFHCMPLYVFNVFLCILSLYSYVRFQCIPM